MGPIMVAQFGSIEAYQEGTRIGNPAMTQPTPQRNAISMLPQNMPTLTPCASSSKSYAERLLSPLALESSSPMSGWLLMTGCFAGTSPGTRPKTPPPFQREKD